MNLLPTNAERHLRAFLAALPQVTEFRSDAALTPEMTVYSVPRTALQGTLDELDRLRGLLNGIAAFAPYWPPLASPAAAQPVCDDQSPPNEFSEEPLFCTLAPHADGWHQDERRGTRWRHLPAPEGATG